MNLRTILLVGLLGAAAFGGIGYGIWQLSAPEGVQGDPGQAEHVAELPEPQPPEPARADKPDGTGAASDKRCIGADGVGDCGDRPRPYGWSERSPEQLDNAEGRRAEAERRRAEVTRGSPTVRGDLAEEVVIRIVRGHMNEVRVCYERQLVTEPDLAGRLVLTMIISPAGAVQATLVASSTLDSPELEECVQQRARRWRFPSPTGGGIVHVTYPFVFSSEVVPETEGNAAEPAERSPPLDPNGRPMRPGVWTGTVGGSSMRLEGVMRLRPGERPTGAGIYTD